MASSSYQWSFHDGFMWQLYDTSSSDKIEKASQAGNSTVRVKTSGHSYTIDLLRNVQKNDSTGTERKIKREGKSDLTLPVRMASVPYGACKHAPSKSGAISISSGPMPSKSGTFSIPSGPMPSKSGAISISSGPMPSKSGTLCPYGLSLSSTPDILSTRPLSGPKTSGTRPLSTPTDLAGSSPVAMPRKKYKPEPTKFPHGLGAYDTFFHKYTQIIIGKKIPKDETCPICLSSLLEPADVETPRKSSSSSLPLDVVSGLKKCSHMFHMACLGTMLDSTPSVKTLELSISCPICQTIHGVKTGDQPRTGTMDVSYEAGCVPGYESYGTIRIKYSFRNGVSETGTNFNAAGFPRVCYVPRCPEGEKVLELLKLAWSRRLIFTIGTSVTTGCENCVVWNNIHHKTEPHSNTSGHGFPDPNFLKNIKMELAVQGVTEEELK